MDALPWVTPVYKRDLTIENYFGGYLQHPYISFYTGRGCKSRCTFCLWPQTVGGHRYRVRSVENVVAEMKWAKNAFPQVKEFFFDDDTLTDNLPRVEALAKELGKLGVTWSCNAKANVPRRTLEVMKDNGLRLLLVGYESGNQQILFNIKKGMRVEFARRFTKDCHELGIVIHGTFILGLPGETRETIQQTLDFAKEINPHTIQVSLAAPYPGTFLYRQAKENGWLYNEEIDLLTQEGTQIAPLNYPHLSHGEIFNSVEDFYKKFYFRPSKIAAIVAEMIASPGDDEAPSARGRGILPLPADAAGQCLKRLIVTADDFGVAAKSTTPSKQAHRRGVLTAASLMVSAPAAADAAARARRMPSLARRSASGAGGRPAAASRRCRAQLVDGNGVFRSNMAALATVIAFSRQARRQLAAEITAQFEAFRATGLTLDHCNAHKHFHLHPVVGGLIATIGPRFGLRAVRVPLEPPQVLRRIEPATPWAPALLTAPFALLLRRRLARCRAPRARSGLRTSMVRANDRGTVWRV